MRRYFAGLLFGFMTLSGAIDTYRLLIPSLNTFQMYSSEDLSLTQWIKEYTGPHTVWLTGAYHNNFLFNLAGRQSIMTYEGWLWTHGYNFESIRADVVDMFTRPERHPLFSQYGVDFILIGPVERAQWGADAERFKKNFQLVKKTDHYAIFSTGKSRLLKEEPKLILEGAKLNAARDITDDLYLRPALQESTYPNIYFSGKPSMQLASEIDFDYAGDQKRPFPAPCSIQWDGYLKILNPGTYEFILESDDGSWLYLDDTLVLDNGGLHGAIRVSKKVFLEKGYHQIQVQYFDATGGAVARLRWIPEGKEEQLVSGEYLFNDIRQRPKELPLF